ncbi:hypothetical protein SAMN05421831_101341 [Allopseudospirillum japonicum]|uniref:Uncharacterized protein n=1 Tax=Allopseudospirillum japonicum TaxID=64971 RepID=A0A1H6QIT4_9GAMM|nr:hypothetical protein [Allopseudospirillum japonicum]SEI40874.1 hypothetical protein SAMN05421831_101341 [Allopseudospirillum japonicum]
MSFLLFVAGFALGVFAHAIWRKPSSHMKTSANLAGTQLEPPRDYAPKPAQAKGTLAEDYGLKEKETQSPTA